METVLKGSKCPVCGNTLDMATSVLGEYTPSPNDVTVCICCASILIFSDDLTLRKILAEEIYDLPDDVLKVINCAKNAIRQIKYGKENGN